MNTQDHLKHIVIVGGGTAGWITAAALSKALRGLGCQISLIESEAIGRIGVGEATIPPIVDFIRYLGINEDDFLMATNGTFKLGIKFQDWHTQGESYWHPFGSIGARIDGIEFLQHWIRARNSEPTIPSYTSFSPSAVMGDHNKFLHPKRADNRSLVAGASYAYHFDANLVASYLRHYAETNGVKRIEDKVLAVLQDPDGSITQLQLDKNHYIEADFYIDCTGFSSLLIGGSLKAEYDDWSDYLPCNRAIAVPSEVDSVIPPYTLSTARSAGWTWKIPLQNRIGNGYVYSSEFCSDTEAEETLLKSIQGKALADPRVIPFKTGCRKQIWKNNCLSIGLSSGFVEPLESTAIHLITKGVKTFINLLPNRTSSDHLAEEYNKIMYSEYERIRDFIVLHYCATKREDTEFWKWCQNDMKISESLQHKISLFKARGKLQDTSTELFKDPSWHCVLLGMGVNPGSYDPMADKSDIHMTKKIIADIFAQIVGSVKEIPDHKSFYE